jgi:hypothetical protein
VVKGEICEREFTCPSLEKVSAELTEGVLDKEEKS